VLVFGGFFSFLAFFNENCLIFDELGWFLGPSGKWVGAFGVSDDREKSFGAPDVQITPLAALIWPSAQTIFLSTQPQGPDMFNAPNH